MNQEQYDQRRQYVEQVKMSFLNGADSSGNGAREKYPPRYYDSETGQEARVPRSFFKLRLAIAVLLFLGFLFLRQTDLELYGMNAGTIQEKIESTISLPENFPGRSELTDWFHILSAPDTQSEKL